MASHTSPSNLERLYQTFCSHRKRTVSWTLPPHTMPPPAFFTRHYDLDLFLCPYIGLPLLFFNCCVIFPGMVDLSISFWTLGFWPVFTITDNAVKTLPVHMPWAHVQEFLLGFWIGWYLQRFPEFYYWLFVLFFNHY